ncbi:hypothetical protein [Rufibacter tibetensis]|uniref:Uncharacterized protein n=1 Tax=Rufibacter tibetensis TaxID=512763 RepID=A0A0P0D299_9BACT|nr:hypothetical protein [Rufibacter tibetensis]ALJ01052.1 hypothetical protein DC20_21215 [Rufibacter tibetensis]
MRSIFILMFLLLFAGKVYSQEKAIIPLKTKAEYLELSKSQKVAGFIFLGGGMALLAYAAPGNVSFDTLPFVVIGGAGLTLGSIPFFISAGKNRKRAMNAATSLELRRLSPSPSTGQSSAATFLTLHLKL